MIRTPLLSRDYEFSVEEITNCPVCNSRQRQLLFVGYDDRFGQPDEFPVVECLECGLGYLGIRVAVGDAGRLYSKYYGKSYFPPVGVTGVGRLKHTVKLSLLYKIYRRFSSRIDLYNEISMRPLERPRVLDIGNGAGAAVYGAHYIVNVLKGSWIGIDIDEHVCAKIRDLGFEAFCCKLEDFAKRESLSNHLGSFTHIVASQLIEHIYNPRSFLQAASALMSPDGRLIVSCPNYDSFFKRRFGKKWIHWHIPYHLYHFNDNNLKILLARSALELIKFNTVTPATWETMQSRFRMPGRGEYNAFMSAKGGLFRQLIVDLRFRRENRSGQGDAIVLVAKKIG